MSDTDVLAAAARAVAANGLPNLTLATVAREAGLSPATLVQRFGSKRGLLLALAERSAPGVPESFERARATASTGSPLAVLHVAMAGFAGGVRSRGELANHLTFLHMDLTDPQFHIHARAHAEAMNGEIAALLTEAVAAGELTAEADVERLARAVLVTFNGSMITWALTGDDGGALAGTLRADLDSLLAPYRTT
jgi:AcrR family transcriptional regulator